MNKRGCVQVASFIALVFLAFVAYGVHFAHRVSKMEQDHLAERNLYHIYEAQMEFKSARNRYGTLDELAEAGLLQPHLVGDRRALKFNYWISDLSGTTFSAHADRKTSSAGYSDFIIAEDGVLHFRQARSISPLLFRQGALKQQ